jgi:transcriptional regulator with XRE-family HTH domain
MGQAVKGTTKPKNLYAGNGRPEPTCAPARKRRAKRRALWNRKSGPRSVGSAKSSTSRWQSWEPPPAFRPGCCPKSKTARRPSLATLDALSAALNIPISSLFKEREERRDCSFVKKGKGVRIERRGTTVNPITCTICWDIRWAERSALNLFRHAGVEFIFMLSGKVRYRHADRTYVMEPGDALFFDAAARHGPEELIHAADDLSVHHHLSASQLAGGVCFGTVALEVRRSRPLGHPASRPTPSVRSAPVSRSSRSRERRVTRCRPC